MRTVASTDSKVGHYYRREKWLIEMDLWELKVDHATICDGIFIIGVLTKF